MQGKDPSSGCGRDPRSSSRVETGMSGNFLSCSKGVKDPFEVQEGSPLISNSSMNVSLLEIHGRFCQDIRHLNKPQILTSEDLHASVHQV